MVEASAQARLGRALHTRSTPAAQKMDLKIGEELDFYKTPISKDISGWSGPAKVIDLSNLERGIVTV